MACIVSASAQPAELIVAPRASHVVAPFQLLNSELALWTQLDVFPLSSLVVGLVLHLFTGLFGVSLLIAMEAKECLAHAALELRVLLGPFHIALAAWLWTPPHTRVLVYQRPLPEYQVFLKHFLIDEVFDHSVLVLCVAFRHRAVYLENLRVIDLPVEVAFDAHLAKDVTLLTTRVQEDVSVFKVIIANLAVLHVLEMAWVLLLLLSQLHLNLLHVLLVPLEELLSVHLLLFLLALASIDDRLQVFFICVLAY